jgi:predicted Rossmann fold flavoprotein
MKKLTLLQILKVNNQSSFTYDLIIVGGGAAGFFCAINYAILYPKNKILILEKSSKLLSKVRISGGGRCNVTHACFDPKELISYYPRGAQELLGPFHYFDCGDTMAWFDERGVDLKIEDDGRVFPESNKSECIIDCFMKEVAKYNIEIKLSTAMDEFEKEGDIFKIKSKSQIFQSKNLFLAAGSSPKVWNYLKTKDIPIIHPVPSLFTFNIKDQKLNDLKGTSLPNVGIKIPAIKTEEDGAFLITHWGISGPTVLKISSRAARTLAKINYEFEIVLDLLPFHEEEDILNFRKSNGKHAVGGKPMELSKRFWNYLIESCKIDKTKNWADLNKKELVELVKHLKAWTLPVKGKSTFKDEFVTAGGIDLKAINFKTYESKQIPRLYFGGEVINIDALTGGFNFQAAWTSGWIAANAME